MKNRELRCAKVTELRIEVKEGLPMIQGHAAIFDSLSQDLGGIFPFKERICKGAFKASLESDDIRALWNHDPNYILGRNKAGTLELKETVKGLLVRIYPPDTQWARDLSESIKRGDITQMSFGFVCEKDTWTFENGEDIRTLEQVKLFDVSPVTFPAYLDTDIGVRSVMEGYDNHKKTQEKRAAEDAQKRAELDRLKQKFTIKEQDKQDE